MGQQDQSRESLKKALPEMCNVKIESSAPAVSLCRLVLLPMKLLCRRLEPIAQRLDWEPGHVSHNAVLFTQNQYQGTNWCHEFSGIPLIRANMHMRNTNGHHLEELLSVPFNSSQNLSLEYPWDELKCQQLHTAILLAKYANTSICSSFVSYAAVCSYLNYYCALSVCSGSRVLYVYPISHLLQI